MALQRRRVLVAHHCFWTLDDNAGVLDPFVADHAKQFTRCSHVTFDVESRRGLKELAVRGGKGALSAFDWVFPADDELVALIAAVLLGVRFVGWIRGWVAEMKGSELANEGPAFSCTAGASAMTISADVRFWVSSFG